MYCTECGKLCDLYRHSNTFMWLCCDNTDTGRVLCLSCMDEPTYDTVVEGLAIAQNKVLTQAIHSGTMN
ncbi:hypothetical protein LCGC14_0755060 [marine sediment metagenome]|uniref:Uncharacterized protein n=1 Tax=marine sediment metagenome TaxID=412755 RepID=A0A0F9QMR0_9ZZZZ